MTDTASVKGPLTGKVAGEPVWMWIVGVVVLAVGVQWYRQRSAAVRAAAAPTLSAAPLTQDPATMGTGTLPAGAGVPSAQPGPTMTTEQWLAAALKAAKNAGEDPLHASRALSNFLNGGNLSYADTLVVNAAVDAIGTPPGYSTIPPGNWDTRSMPQPVPTAKITGFVRPAGTAQTFAQYSDGTLVWLKDGISTADVIANAPVGVSKDIVDLPVNDPRWQNADVVKNKDPYYVWSNKWANYVVPTQYLNRTDIVTDPATLAAADAAWQRSQAAMATTTAPHSSQAYADAAYNAAFPNNPRPI